MTEQTMTKQEIMDALDRAMQAAQQLMDTIGEFDPRAKPLDARRSGEVNSRAFGVYWEANSLATMLDVNFRYPSLPERDSDDDPPADC